MHISRISEIYHREVHKEIKQNDEKYEQTNLNAYKMFLV
jgi:hypothetical protein